MTLTHVWARQAKWAIVSIRTLCGSTMVIAPLGLNGVQVPLVLHDATATLVFQTYVDELMAPEVHIGYVVIYYNFKQYLDPHVA